MIIPSELLPIRKKLATPELQLLLPRWQQNNSPEDLGIIRFGFDLFPDTLKKEYGVADWVRPTLYRILRFDPEMTKIDRAWAICTSRDFSKSTWIAKILPLYLMLVGQYGIYTNGHLLPEADYIRLRAKTQEKAEEKLGNVSMEFDNPRVIKLFGELRPTLKEIRDKKLKNQAKLVILKNGYIFQAQGLNMPSRGANIRDRRPKVDINDDVENKENTKTDTMRAYNAKEILGEQFGGLDHRGLTVYIGNYVHQECILAKLMKPNSGWNRLFFQATYFDKDGVERSGWAKRYSVDYIKRLGEWYRRQTDLGGWKIFRMEFYNEIISDMDFQIYYFDGELVRKYKENYLIIRALYYKVGNEFKPLTVLEKPLILRVYIVVSGDPAISEDKKSSDGVATATAYAEDKNRYIIDIQLDKFDMNDKYHDPFKKPKILAISDEEKANIRRRGLTSEMARMILKYNADAWVLENAGQQLAWYNELKYDILKPLGLGHLPGLAYHPKDEKVYKLTVGLMNYYSAGKYFILRNLQFRAMHDIQVNTFPDNKLDILDTLHNAEKMARFPHKSDFNVYGERRPYKDEETYKPPPGVEPWMIIG